MAHGMRIWGANGQLQLDETSFTVRVVYSVLIVRASGENRTRYYSIPGVDPSTHSAVCVPIAAYSTTAQSYASIQYTPVVNSGGVTIYFGCPATQTGPMGTSTQRLLVMRNR